MNVKHDLPLSKIRSNFTWMTDWWMTDQMTLCLLFLCIRNLVNKWNFRRRSHWWRASYLLWSFQESLTKYVRWDFCCFIYTASLNLQDIDMDVPVWKIQNWWFMFSLVIESVHFNDCAYLFCSCTTEVKHPLPHLDQWRHLAGQCVSGLYPGMGCWVTEQGPGNKFSVINYGFICIYISPAQNALHFMDFVWFSIIQFKVIQS